MSPQARIKKQSLQISPDFNPILMPKISPFQYDGYIIEKEKKYV